MPKKQVEKKKNTLATKPRTMKEESATWLGDSEIQRVQHKVGFNGLAPSQWALFSKKCLG